MGLSLQLGCLFFSWLWADCHAGRVLVGIHVSPPLLDTTTDSALSIQTMLWLSASLEVAEVAKERIRSTWNHQSDLFVCFTADVTDMISTPAVSLLVERKIPFYFSALDKNYPCTLEYPSNNIGDYIALIHLDVASSSHPDPLLSPTSRLGSGDGSTHPVFSLPIAALQEAVSIQRSGPQHSSLHSHRVRKLISRVLLEHSGRVNLTSLLTQAVERQLPTRATPSPPHELFPMFLPASTAVKHESGSCQLWWPLHGGERLILPSAKPNETIEAINIVACEKNQPGEDVTYRTSIVDRHNASIAASAGVVTADMPVGSYSPISLKFNMPIEAGPFTVKLDVVSSTRGLLSHFEVSQTPLLLADIPLSHNHVGAMNSRLPYREYLGNFLNALDLKGTYVEIGVHTGEFASVVLADWEGRHYVAVDPWVEEFQEDYIDDVNSPSKDRRSDMQMFYDAVAPHQSKVTVLRMFSTEAAGRFVDGSVDAVYIDAIHHYHQVMRDMQHWWPKIKSGGVMAGHDYFLAVYGKAVFTVKPAVLEFARFVNLPVFQTDDAVSWYILKP